MKKTAVVNYYLSIITLNISVLFLLNKMMEWIKDRSKIQLYATFERPTSTERMNLGLK